MTPQQLHLLRELHDEEKRPTTSEPFFLGPETYDAIGAAVEEIERLQAAAVEEISSNLLRTLRESSAAYRVGLKEGIARYAWWRDGVQYVGTCGKTLAQAIRELNNET